MTLLWTWFSSQENISLLANLVTIFGLPIAIFGLFIVSRQMKNDRLAVSASAISDMRSSIMARIERLSTAGSQEGKLEGEPSETEAAWQKEFAEFANDLEMACAVYLDGQMSGRTGELARRMICDLLDMINDDDDVRRHLQSLIHANDTFINLRDFRQKMRSNV